MWEVMTCFDGEIRIYNQYWDTELVPYPQSLVNAKALARILNSGEEFEDAMYRFSASDEAPGTG